MVTVIPAKNPDTDAGYGRRHLDRPVLISNLVSGALCLLVVTPLVFGLGLGVIPLFLIGLVYVVAASLFFATAYSREPLSTRRELVTWIVPWLAASALWTAVLASIDSSACDDQFRNACSDDAWISTDTIFAGLVVGTGCYLAWRAAALATRQFFAWQSGEALLPVDPDESREERRPDAHL